MGGIPEGSGGVSADCPCSLRLHEATLSRVLYLIMTDTIEYAAPVNL